MKAFKLFWKIFAVLSTIFVLGFFSYNLWDDYVRTGFSESPGYEWIANKMPEYEEQDLAVSASSEDPTNIRDIEAEIEAEMAEKDKENDSSDDKETDTENNETDTEESDPPVDEDADLDIKSAETEEVSDEDESTDVEENETDEEQEEEETSSASASKIANNTSNCFNIVDGGMTCPKPEEIIYIEAESGKATIYLKERKKFFVAHSLTALHGQLGQQDGFYKTKKYVINLNHLIAFIPKGQPNSSSRKIDLELIDSKEISIPYAHLNPLKAAYIQVRGIDNMK